MYYRQFKNKDFERNKRNLHCRPSEKCEKTQETSMAGRTSSIVNLIRTRPVEMEEVERLLNTWIEYQLETKLKTIFLAIKERVSST